jgi:hypothetical protein
MDGFEGSIREIVTALAVGLLFGLVVSWGAIYGIDRFLVPEDQAAEITGTVRLPRSPN